MNNDNRDDRDSRPEGDAEQQLGFDSDRFESSASGGRRDRFFGAFDDETTEIDDVEPGDYGDDFDADDPRDDTFDLWDEDEGDDTAGSDSGLNAAEELKALWDDDPAPEPQDTRQPRDDAPAAGVTETVADPDEDAPDFSNWPHDEPDEDLEPPELPESAAPDFDDDDDAYEPEHPEPAVADRYFDDSEEMAAAATDAEVEPEAPELWDLQDPEDDAEPRATVDGDEWRAAAAAALSTGAALSAREADDEDRNETWDSGADDDADEPWDEDDWDDNDDSPRRRQIPWGLVAVAGLALLLLGAGGFGILQERSALQEEVTELQSQLATSASPEEVTAARESLRTMEESRARLEEEIARLELDNRRLTDMVAGLESQLKNQANAVEALERSAEQAKAAARQSAAASAAATDSEAGTWFVNFGSYGDRTIAEDWASRLRKDYGKVIVAPATSQGRSVYRVRVIGLPGKTEAERVARQLEQAHGLPRLWIGSE